jgi:hypothetical protein
MQAQTDTSSLGKTRPNPANQAINQATPNNERNNNHIIPAHTPPTLPCITPDDATNDSVFQSTESFSMLNN